MLELFVLVSSIFLFIQFHLLINFLMRSVKRSVYLCSYFICTQTALEWVIGKFLSVKWLLTFRDYLSETEVQIGEGNITFFQ